MRPWQGLLGVNAGGQPVQHVIVQIGLRILDHRSGITDDPVADNKGLFGGFHHAVDMGEALGLAHLQAVEQSQNHQGRQALRRRREVEHPRARHIHRQRLAPLGVVGIQVGQCHRRATGGEIGGNVTRQCTAIEILGAIAADPAQSLAQSGQFHPRALTRGLVAGQKGFGEIRLVLQFGLLFRRQFLLAAGDGKTVFRRPDGIFQQTRQRQSAAHFAAERHGLAPARHRARHRIGCQRAAPRDRVVPVSGIERGCRCHGRATAGIKGHGILPGRADQPEPVPANRRHMRIDHGQHRRHGNRRFDGIATVAQHPQAGLAGQMMRGCDHATAGAGSIEHHGLFSTTGKG